MKSYNLFTVVVSLSVLSNVSVNNVLKDELADNSLIPCNCNL